MTMPVEHMYIYYVVLGARFGLKIVKAADITAAFTDSIGCLCMSSQRQMKTCFTDT